MSENNENNEIITRDNPINIVHETGLDIGRGNPDYMTTSEGGIYRLTGKPQIADIIDSGMVRPKEGGKVKGGNANAVYWSKGRDTLRYNLKGMGNYYVIEIPANTLEKSKVGAVDIYTITSIWHWDDENQCLVDVIEEVRQEYEERHSPKSAPSEESCPEQ